jgi:hypothetical protein
MMRSLVILRRMYNELIKVGQIHRDLLRIKERCVRTFDNFCGSPEGMRQLGRPRLRWRIISICVLNKFDGRMRIALIWLMVRTNGVVLWRR